MKPLVSIIPEPDRSTEARKAIPRAWKDAALVRTGGQCARLDCEVTTGLEFDHIIALGLQGRHAAENIEPLCGPHHLIKTKRDVEMIARAKRRALETCQGATKQIPQRPNPWGPKGIRKLQSAGFRKPANDDRNAGRNETQTQGGERE